MSVERAAKPLRHGVIGTGFMAHVHARAVRASGGEVTRVAGSSRARAEQCAEAMHAERVAASPEDLITADDVDVVHVCTPNDLHAPMAAAALAAGKHVVCEKPLDLDAAGAQHLTALAAEAGAVAVVPFVYRFYPVVRQARAVVAEGGAGDLWLLHGSYLQDWLSAAAAVNWRVDASRGGASRTFGDIGIHWCDLMEFVTGHRITALCAVTARAHQERAGVAVSTEDGALVTFETDRGATGSLVVSQASPGRKNRLTFSFDGTLAALGFDQERPEDLWVGGVAGNRSLARDPDALAPGAARYAVLPAGHPQGYQDCFNAFVSDAAAAVRGHRVDGLPTFADGMRSAQITETVLRSARSREWMEVPS